MTVSVRETGAPLEVTEERAAGALPLWRHTGWDERFPWLVQGTTGRGDAGEDGEVWDFGLAGGQPVGATLDRWRSLRRELGLPAAIHSRQVHAAEIAGYANALLPGLLITEGFDGHVCGRPGVLLTVTVADCVPVFVVDPERRALGLLHAGWRGIAAGIVARGINRLRAMFGSEPADLWLHAGPAICGSCYEVGPEVHRAVAPEAAVPTQPTPIDLRARIAQRAANLGISPSRISVSAFCTRCGPPHFFSHRAGSPARQLAVLAIRS